MIDLSVNIGELAARVATVLDRPCRLTPLRVKCTYPVFKGEADGLSPFFVKVGLREEWRRTVDVLRDVGDCGLFARLMTDEPVEWKGYTVFLSEWRDSHVVFPEDMTDRQADSFADGCVRLSQALQKAKPPTVAGPEGRSPETLYEEVVRYVARHPFAGRLLNDLVAIPEAERTFGGRELSVVHGDFHAKNFGFAGDSLASVFDFDKLSRGRACGDLTNALVERFSCLRLSAAARRRLTRVARRVLARVPWSREDVVVSVNVLRLWFAARRIMKHPDSAWVALDIVRRDRKIRGIFKCLEGK